MPQLDIFSVFSLAFAIAERGLLKWLQPLMTVQDHSLYFTFKSKLTLSAMLD